MIKNIQEYYQCILDNLTGGLISVDLAATDRRTLARFMGAEAARRFVSCHSGACHAGAPRAPGKAGPRVAGA